MSISREEVTKVSLLARLQLSEDELTAMTAHLSNVVGYIDQLSEVDTEGVEPIAHAIELTNVFAADESRESLPREAALANAPHADDECFLVPAVLGER